MELWTMKVPAVAGMEDQARRAEEAGWHGVTYTDSQNLCPDPFVGIALAARATEHLRFATGVTNAHTRHPAALATTASTVGAVSGGRFVLGIGRGDTALFHLGLPPMPVATFAERIAQLQTYLGGGTVDAGGHESRIRWLRPSGGERTDRPSGGERTDPPSGGERGSPVGKVPIDIAASGPKVIALAARTAERVTLALGADPDRVAWGIDHARTAAADAGRDPDTISFGSYVSIGCHPDPEVARAMIAGSVAAFTHFSAMPGSTGDGLAEQDRGVVAEVGRRYDSHQHLRNDAEHNGALEPGFIDRFGVTGPPERVIERLRELASLGIDRFVVTGPGFGTRRDEARTANRLLLGEVLPALGREAVGG